MAFVKNAALARPRSVLPGSDPQKAPTRLTGRLLWPRAWLRRPVRTPAVVHDRDPAAHRMLKVPGVHPSLVTSRRDVAPAPSGHAVVHPHLCSRRKDRHDTKRSPRTRSHVERTSGRCRECHCRERQQQGRSKEHLPDGGSGHGCPRPAPLSSSEQAFRCGASCLRRARCRKPLCCRRPSHASRKRCVHCLEDDAGSA